MLTYLCHESACTLAPTETANKGLHRLYQVPDSVVWYAPFFGRYCENSWMSWLSWMTKCLRDSPPVALRPL